VLHLLERIESLNREKKSTSLSLSVQAVHVHGGVAIIQTKFRRALLRGASMFFSFAPGFARTNIGTQNLHTAFFIFLVSNLGGGLTPMGSPLFLGYLKGVPFWRMIQRCWLVCSVALLSCFLIFYLVDRTYIGNSPNFTIKAIAEQHKMRTPSFVGFVIKFSLPILLLICWLTLPG
jgi:Putative citrate transport